MRRAEEETIGTIILSSSHFVTLQTAADERPTAQRGDCLWLLYFYPDQVHRSPLRGPLIRCRGGPMMLYGLRYKRSNQRFSPRFLA